MKTLNVLEPKDITKIRKARDLTWKAHNVLTITREKCEEHLIEAKRMLDELLVEVG